MPEPIRSRLGDGIIDPACWDPETELIVQDGLKWRDDLYGLLVNLGELVEIVQARGRIC